MHPSCRFLAEAACENLLQPLSFLAIQPSNILLLGYFDAASLHKISAGYPKAQVVQHSSHQVSLDLANASVDLLIVSLVGDFQQQIFSRLPQFRRWLRQNGVLIFSACGAGSFIEYRTFWQQHGNTSIVYKDLHDYGDALLEAGFADPVLSADTVYLEYTQPLKAWREARKLAGTPPHDPPLSRLQLQATLQADWLHNTVEIVYAHAFAPHNISPHFIPLVVEN